jgi:hypothetical protein
MRGELHCGVAEYRLVDDRLAAIHALGLVADHLHGHEARDAGALEVPHRRPSEVVQDASWDASRRTRLLPCRRMTRARLRSLAEQTRGS